MPFKPNPLVMQIMKDNAEFFKNLLDETTLENENIHPAVKELYQRMQKIFRENAQGKSYQQEMTNCFEFIDA